MSGLSFDQAIAKAEEIGNGAIIQTVIATNQENGIVSYVTGSLLFVKASTSGTGFMLEHIATSKDQPLTALFSDRSFHCPATGGVPDLLAKPFSVNAADKMGLTIVVGQGTSGLKASFTLVSHGNHTFSFPLQKIGGLLIGIGDPIGNRTKDAVYLFSFPDVSSPPR